AATTGFGLVSDTVFGLDGQVAIHVRGMSKDAFPVLYGEAAFSKFSPDYRNVASVTDSAAVIGARLTFGQTKATVQYQVVGANYLDGAPYAYFGNAPAIFTNWKRAYLPSFFGVSNNFAINGIFDSQLNAAGIASVTQKNPNLTFASIAVNPFAPYSPTYFQAFAPNSVGPTLTLLFPLHIGDLNVRGRIVAQHLTEIGASQDTAFHTSERETIDKVDGSAAFSVPVAGKVAAVTLGSIYEHLRRNDGTLTAYVPLDPGTGLPDANSAALVARAFGGSPVLFAPNYVNIRHYTVSAGATLPVTDNISLGTTYNSQHFGGAYQSTLGDTMSQRKDTIFGNITYSIPKTTSTVALIARQYKYTDDVVPSFNLTQNRQDILFTVRF
ncbi:MAG TPA: hypothetical protein VKJ77_09515, partial [Caballeronia sp.]|nr:hypothetical protein [Caballeronia sp.]